MFKQCENSDMILLQSVVWNKSVAVVQNACAALKQL